jgi:hypothetical protein
MERDIGSYEDDEATYVFNFFHADIGVERYWYC